MQSDDGRLARLPHLLRYCALHLAPRRDVASLRGQAWVDWLNARAGQALFTLDDAVRLDALAYGRRGAEPGDARLAARCRAWLRGGHARV